MNFEPQNYKSDREIENCRHIISSQAPSVSSQVVNCCYIVPAHCQATWKLTDGAWELKMRSQLAILALPPCFLPPQSTKSPFKVKAKVTSYHCNSSFSTPFMSNNINSLFPLKFSCGRVCFEAMHVWVGEATLKGITSTSKLLVKDSCASLSGRNFWL